MKFWWLSNCSRLLLDLSITPVLAVSWCRHVAADTRKAAYGSWSLVWEPSPAATNRALSVLRITVISLAAQTHTHMHAWMVCTHSVKKVQVAGDNVAVAVLFFKATVRHRVFSYLQYMCEKRAHNPWEVVGAKVEWKWSWVLCGLPSQTATVTMVICVC